MKICMIVFNSATRDGRVMREAHTLRAAGHEVHVVGVPEPDSATAPLETMPDGVVVHRVPWSDESNRRAKQTAILRLLPLVLLFALVVQLFGGWAFAWHLMQGAAQWVAANGALGMIAGISTVVALLGASYWILRRRYLLRRLLMRLANGSGGPVVPKPWMAEGTNPGVNGEPFPVIRSRIPAWVPEFVLEILLEPFHWIGGRGGRFVLYRFRSKIVANYAIGLKPDVVHCHDCIALPAGVLVKQALGIPLVYDAHEIYEAAAASRSGITDYYGRIHARFLKYVDGFVTINKSAAAYYAQAYPYLAPAVIVRNATNAVEPFAYDGRMHEVLGLPTDRKILLYHGGFTAHRGLSTLVRTAPLLPEGWTLVMMGWGPLEAELNAIVKNEKIGTDKLRFMKGVPRDELHLWSAAGTAGVIPYENVVLNHWICSPNKLWEFPSSGVPIIVQPFPELMDVVKTYGCGWVLPADFTAQNIAATVASLTDTMIAEAKKGCRRFIDADNWEAVYEKRLVAFYDTLLRETQRSSGAATTQYGHQT
jgi:glycosyltransferase involved in cell wall biosynthesis